MWKISNLLQLCIRDCNVMPAAVLQCIRNTPAQITCCTQNAATYQNYSHNLNDQMLYSYMFWLFDFRITMSFQRCVYCHFLEAFQAAHNTRYVMFLNIVIIFCWVAQLFSVLLSQQLHLWSFKHISQRKILFQGVRIWWSVHIFNKFCMLTAGSM